MIVVCSYTALPKAILNTINKKNGVTTQRRALDLCVLIVLLMFLKKRVHFLAKALTNQTQALV